ncbi:MAG TPA: four-helix bundle copper-binding protein [Streptosporangiaceae bacterium]|nr:four-helix bundle copper-binding protein [Streptosporangiaceae bacterium]
MSYARQILGSYQSAPGVDAAVLAAAIDAISDCAQACIADNDADLSEQNVTEMVRCIRLCLNCADVCTATGAVVSRPAGYDAEVVRLLLQACVAICKSCGDECERHARMHEHCRVCAEACRRCEQACRELADAMK